MFAKLQCSQLTFHKFRDLVSRPRQIRLTDRTLIAAAFDVKFLIYYLIAENCFDFCYFHNSLQCSNTRNRNVKCLKFRFAAVFFLLDLWIPPIFLIIISHSQNSPRRAKSLVYQKRNVCSDVVVMSSWWMAWMKLLNSVRSLALSFHCREVINFLGELLLLHRKILLRGARGSRDCL